MAAADIEPFSRDAEASLDDLDAEPRPDVLRLHAELWNLRGCHRGACGPVSKRLSAGRGLGVSDGASPLVPPGD